MKRAFAGLSLAIALLAGLAGSGAAQASPDDGWVDVGAKPIQLQAVRQDPLNGQTSPLPLPLNMLPGAAGDLFTTPVGVALNNFWSGTATQVLCNQATGALNGQGTGGFHIYNTSCSLASAGRTTASQQGDKVVISYFLPQNVIESWVTTPLTCAPGHGTIFCPNDPRVSLTADIELQATIEAPGAACDLHVDPFTVQVSNVRLDSQNLTSDIAFDAASLWASLTGTDYVSEAQNLITQGVNMLNQSGFQAQQGLSGKVAAFTSSLCNTIIPHLPGASDGWLLRASVDPVQGIVFQLIDEPPGPPLFHAELRSVEATVVAGSTVQLNGSYFTANGGVVTLTIGGSQPATQSPSRLATRLATRVNAPVVSTLGTATISAQGTFSTTVTIPAGTAAGNLTIHAAGASDQADATIQVATAGAPATLTVSYQGRAFTTFATGEAYTLSGVNLQPGTVAIYLDSPAGLLVETATVGADGTFSHDFQVNSDQLGPHNLVAVQGGAVQAQLAVTLIAPEVIH